ncbi:ADP-ribose pyrophosphatase [Rhodospirillaceae bacterium LM-1]|nr:ADP-ribose pyrophosphatase [Rhodospirillaceae bacterium LM-1]
MDGQERKVELVEKVTAYQGYFRIDRYKLRHSLFAGGLSGVMTRELFERGHAVGLLPYDPVKDAVVLIEQFRIGAYAQGWDPWLLEIVAGIIEEGESHADVAKRETKEEAGIDVTDLVPVHHYLVSPGGATETCALYCGRVNSEHAAGIHGVGAEHEDIRVVVMSADEAIAKLEAGQVVNAAAVIGLQWLALKRGELRRRWLSCGC